MIWRVYLTQSVNMFKLEQKSKCQFKTPFLLFPFLCAITTTYLLSYQRFSCGGNHPLSSLSSYRATTIVASSRRRCPITSNVIGRKFVWWVVEDGNRKFVEENRLCKRKNTRARVWEEQEEAPTQSNHGDIISGGRNEEGGEMRNEREVNKWVIV